MTEKKYLKLERVIIQEQVADRLPPSIFQDMFDWQLPSSYFSRVFIAHTDIELADQIKRSEKLGFFPIVIVEDSRSKDWNQWQIDNDLGAFSIGFFLQDEEQCLQRIHPHMPLLESLNACLQGDETITISADPEVAIAYGESFKIWAALWPKQVKQIFGEKIKINKQDLQYSKDEIRYWKPFPAASINKQGNLEGMFAALESAGVIINFEQCIFNFFIFDKMTSRLSITLHSALELPGGFKDFIHQGALAACAEATSQMAMARGSGGKPIPCLPLFDNDQKVVGMRMLIDNTQLSEDITVNISINEEFEYPDLTIEPEKDNEPTTAVCQLSKPLRMDPDCTLSAQLSGNQITIQLTEV